MKYQKSLPTFEFNLDDETDRNWNHVPAGIDADSDGRGFQLNHKFGKDERETLTYGPIGSEPSTHGGPTAPGYYETEPCFEAMASEQSRGTVCAAAFRSEDVRFRDDSQAADGPGPGEYGVPPVLMDTWPQPQTLGGNPAGNARPGMVAPGQPLERTNAVFRKETSVSRISRIDRYGDEDGQGPGRYWGHEMEALHDICLKDVAFSVRGSSAFAAAARKPTGYYSHGAQLWGHEVGTAAAGWINNAAVKTPGIRRADNSAADVALDNDRRHWKRQIGGAATQATQRFDQYWDTELERPAVRHRQSIHGSKSTASFSDARKTEAIGGGFRKMLEQLMVPADAAAKMEKSISSTHKKELLKRHQATALATLACATASEINNSRNKTSDWGSISNSSISTIGSSLSVSGTTMQRQPKHRPSSSGSGNMRSRPGNGWPGNKKPPRRAQSAGSLGGKHSGRSQYHVSYSQRPKSQPETCGYWPVEMLTAKRSGRAGEAIERWASKGGSDAGSSQIGSLSQSCIDLSDYRFPSHDSLMGSTT